MGKLDLSVLVPALVLCLGVVSPLGAQGEETLLADRIEEPEAVLVDRVVALVDGDPILSSDIHQVLVLGLVEPSPEESQAALERRVLDLLIVERLRHHEVDRFGFEPVPPEKVDEQLSRVKSRWESDEEFLSALAEVNLEEVDLRRILSRQIQVLVFVEERLGPRVFVGMAEIRAYYEEVLTPRLEEERAPVPPLDEVREQIRAVLKEERLNEELDLWTEQLRQDADIVDSLDDPGARP